MAATQEEELDWRMFPDVVAMSSSDGIEETTSRTTSGRTLMKRQRKITPSASPGCKLRMYCNIAVGVLSPKKPS